MKSKRLRSCVGAKELGDVYHCAAALVLDQEFYCGLIRDKHEAVTRRAELLLAVSGRERVSIVERPGKASEATATVAAAFRRDARGASCSLSSAWFGAFSTARRSEIEEWARRSLERSSVGGPHLVGLWSRVRRDDYQSWRNMTAPLATQLLGLVEDLGLKVCLFGDPIDSIAASLDLRALPLNAPFDRDDSLIAQLYLHQLLLKDGRFVCSIGAKSGAMDGPALLGVPTLSLVGAISQEERMVQWCGPVPRYELVPASCLLPDSCAVGLTTDELQGVAAFLRECVRRHGERSGDTSR